MILLSPEKPWCRLCIPVPGNDSAGESGLALETPIEPVDVSSIMYGRFARCVGKVWACWVDWRLRGESDELKKICERPDLEKCGFNSRQYNDLDLQTDYLGGLMQGRELYGQKPWRALATYKLGCQKMADIIMADALANMARTNINDEHATRLLCVLLENEKRHPTQELKIKQVLTKVSEQLLGREVTRGKVGLLSDELSHVDYWAKLYRTAIPVRRISMRQNLAILESLPLREWVSAHYGYWVDGR